MKISFLALCTTLCFTFHLPDTAQARSFAVVDSLPTAFLLGENDGVDFDLLQMQYNTSLLTVCNSDMDLAYYAWVHLLQHIQTFAKQQNLDLEGVKMWLYAFWNKDGSIAHLAYHLKPNSRNIKTDDFTALLVRFVKDYKLPIKGDKEFSNYNNAAFPVMLEKGSK